MEHSRISSKGQLVIPKILREKLDWREGDEILFSQENGKLMLQALTKRDLQEVLAKLQGATSRLEVDSFEDLLETEKQTAKKRRTTGRK
jgi:antitoxin PrlF